MPDTADVLVIKFPDPDSDGGHMRDQRHESVGALVGASLGRTVLTIVARANDTGHPTQFEDAIGRLHSAGQQSWQTIVIDAHGCEAGIWVPGTNPNGHLRLVTPTEFVSGSMGVSQLQTAALVVGACEQDLSTWTAVAPGAQVAVYAGIIRQSLSRRLAACAGAISHADLVDAEAWRRRRDQLAYLPPEVLSPGARKLRELAPRLTKALADREAKTRRRGWLLA